MDMSESLPPVAPAQTAVETSTRSWEVLCHLSAIIGLLGVPLGNILGPLIVWLIKKGDSPGVDAHGKESLNFHISWTIYGLAIAAIAVVLMFVLVGFLILPILAIGWVTMLILIIMGSVKASNGILYRYPLTIRFLQ
jgi:uncharacterized Tic20 family protein